MVVVKLQGGLGNQMFQYATARGINGSSGEIIVDPEFLLRNVESTELFTARRYELDIFPNLRARIASRFLHALLCNKAFPFKGIRKLFYPGFRYVKQVGYDYVRSFPNSGTIYLDGYFQSEKYFQSKRIELRNEFVFPSLDLENIGQVKSIQNQANPVSIHVRRGDYLKPHVLHHHGILPLSYYKSAIEQVESIVSNPYYFIFSDDLEWCRQNFSFLHGGFKIMDVDNSKDAWKDMCLMTYCKHHIVANSSFSWWGAWLAKEKGVKLAPVKWFNPDSVQFNIADFVPSSWQIIRYD